MARWLNDLDRWGERPAIITHGGVVVTYTELDKELAELGERLGSSRQLVLIEAKNELEPLLWYLACVRSRHPVMLVPSDRSDIDALLRTYRPNRRLVKVGGAWTMQPLHDEAPAMHDDLAVLLSTSGSTGTAKFVRLSHDNVVANAESICTYLEMTPDDRAITSLPFHYSYGLSVVNSHLIAGGALLLTDQSVVDPTFWSFFRREAATSIAAVPYTFELLDRVGFAGMDLPSLRYVTAAGGRVPPEVVVRYARTASSKGWQLFVMYGQTEATARMAYVPPSLIAQMPGAIGQPIPGGEFELRADDGTTIDEPGRTGELVYRGRNVMMGYARSRDDLAAGPLLTELATGDLAQADGRGMYSIVGRKSRFLKLFGLRVALDELEACLHTNGYRAVVSGTDDYLAVATLDKGSSTAIRDLVCAASTLPPHVVAVIEYADYPLLESGKVDYGRIRDEARETLARRDASQLVPSAKGSRRSSRSLRTAYADVLRSPNVDPDDTFVSLGGDSLSYIQVEMAIESTLGYVPRDWHRMSIRELESIDRRETKLRSMEMSVVLRAVAMTLVVAGHLGAFYFPGGSIALFAIAGLNFARFQFPAITMHDSPRPAISALARIVVPTMLYTLAITIYYGFTPSIPITFMYSNLVDMTLNDGLSFWFIELLAQLVLVMTLLFSWKGLRRAAAANPRRFGFGLLAVSLAARFVGPLLWDTDHLLNRVPHAFVWLIAFGWCVYFMQSMSERLVLTAVAVGTAPFAFHGSTPKLLGLIGLTLLVWVERVPMVRGVDRVISMVAAASLYIYLTHYEFLAVLEKVGLDIPILATAVALAGGVAVAWAADRVIDVLSAIWRQQSRSSADAEPQPPVSRTESDRVLVP